MILVAGLLILDLTALVFQKSKVPFLALLIFLWFVFVFSNGLADDFNYSLHLMNPTLAQDKGIGYSLLIKFLSDCGATLFQLKLLVGTFYLVSIGLCGWNLTKRPGLFLALYSIFPFCMDAVQLRFSLAISFVLIGYLYVSKAKGGLKKKAAVFFFACLIGFSFHAAVLFFALLLFAKELSHRDARKLCILVFLGLIVVTRTSLLTQIATLLGVSARLNMVGGVDGSGFANVIRLAVPSLAWMAFGLYLKKTRGDSNAVRVILNANLFCLALIPLVGVASNIYRIETSQFLIYYLVAVNSVGYAGGSNIRKEQADLFGVACLLGIALMGVTLLVLMSMNLNTVLVPLLTSNSILV